MAKERKVKKVQCRHILVGSKELADELKVKIDEEAAKTWGYFAATSSDSA